MKIGTIDYNKRNNITFGAKPIPAEVVEKIQARISKAQIADVFCHTAPDEDVSAAGKYASELLFDLGKKARLIVEEPMKELFKLAGFKKAQLITPEEAVKLPKADLAIIVDFHSKRRLSEQAIESISRYDNHEVIGLDHHTLEPHNLVIPQGFLAQNPFYIDDEARSCSSILYRYAKQTGQSPSPEALQSLYCGMIDDMKKNNLLDVIEKDGKNILVKKPSLEEFKEAEEILDEVSSKLTEEQKSEVLTHLNVLARITPEQKEFQRRLFEERVRVTPNGKLAYVVIEPDNKDWIQLGQDTNSNSKILSDFRRRILEHSNNDKFISPSLRENLKEVEGVAVFYRGPKETNASDEVYKMSFHMNDEFGEKFFNELSPTLLKELNIGGHMRKGETKRGGAFVSCEDKEKCYYMVNEFLNEVNKV